MYKDLAFYIHNQDVNTADKHNIEDHPSGFKAVFYNTSSGCMEEHIECLKLVRDTFSINILNPMSSEDPYLHDWIPELKKFYTFFSNVDPELVKSLREKAWCYNFRYGRYDEQRDYSEKTNELLDKYQGQHCIQIEGPYDSVFAIKDFRTKMQEMRIETVDCHDTMAILFFVKDLEEETLLIAFHNFLEIARIDKETFTHMKQAAENYCKENKPWELIK